MICNEPSGEREKYAASSADIAVAKIPGHMPPNQEATSTAGKSNAL
jgi:hypothetical protein